MVQICAAAALGETRWRCPVFGARPPKARESRGARLRRSAAARAGVAPRKGAVGTLCGAIFRSFFGRAVARGEPGGRGEPGSSGLSYPRALWPARVGVGAADSSQRAKPALSALCKLKRHFAHLLTRPQCARGQKQHHCVLPRRHSTALH